MNLTFSWRTLVGTLLLITLITLAMTIQSQYQENRQLKRSNQALRIERDAAWAQLTHHEKTGGAVTLAARMINHFEGVRYKPYFDGGGVLSVCYGHTGNDIALNKTYTQAECNKWLNDAFGKKNARAKKSFFICKSLNLI